MNADDQQDGALDFRSILRATPDAYLLLAPDFTILDVSDAYLRATMTTRPDIVGRGVFDVFPDDPNEPEANGVANLRASLRAVLATKRSHTMGAQRYPVRRPTGAGSTFEERFWSVVNAPVLDPSGWVACIIHRVEDITELVQLKRQRLEQDRNLQEISLRTHHLGILLDTAPDAMVIVDESARIQLVNAQTEALFGYGRDELIGQPLELLIPERFRQRHREYMSGYFANPVARPMASDLHLTGRRKDASEVPMEVSLSPHREGDRVMVSASIRDVTERRRLEATARKTADWLRSAVESIQDAFALFDADDRLILCNSVFRRLVHAASPGALVGKTYAEVLDAWIEDIDLPEGQNRDDFRRERLTRRLHEPAVTFDVRMRDGRSLRIRDRRTAEGGSVKTVWDLTDDERQATELRDARRAAEAASTAKSEFLSSMSHELRTPLNAILGFAQLLARDKREPLSARHRERVDQIMKGGEHLLRLINDILDLAKIESGRITMSLEPVDVPGVIDEVRGTLIPIADKQGISIVVDCPFAMPMVLADRTRLSQILMNLGSNAIKYNRPNGQVRFAAAVRDQRARVTVSDTGFGIPLDQQGKLFQPFQRAGQEAGSIEGTGIGLVITKRLAEMMGGEVGFESAPDQGSQFWIELPLTEVMPLTAQAAPARASSVAPPVGKRRLVLYVEDNPANVEFMRDLIGTLENIDLLTVPSAELGVDLARARLPDLVIMDINLPGMSGLDALRVLKAAPETAAIPVIALTAAASERDRNRGMEAGFYRYLTKPIDVDELVQALEAGCGRL